MTRPSHTSQGVVLRTVDFGEKDQIVTLLLRGEGRRDAVAYGAKVSRKRFAGALDLFRRVEFTWTEGRPDTLPTLNEATVLEDFEGITRSFEKVTLAAYATEVTRELLRDGHDADESLDILLGYYRHTHASDNDTPRLEADLYSLLLHLLQAAGFGPSLDRCYITGAPVQAGQRFLFSRHGEGALAADARPFGQATLDTTPEALLALTRLSRSYLPPAADPPPKDLRLRLRPLIQTLIQAVIPRELRSARGLPLVLTP